MHLFAIANNLQYSCACILRSLLSECTANAKSLYRCLKLRKKKKAHVSENVQPKGSLQRAWVGKSNSKVLPSETY